MLRRGSRGVALRIDCTGIRPGPQSGRGGGETERSRRPINLVKVLLPRLNRCSHAQELSLHAAKIVPHSRFEGWGRGGEGGGTVSAGMVYANRSLPPQLMLMGWNRPVRAILRAISHLSAPKRRARYTCIQPRAALHSSASAVCWRRAESTTFLSVLPQPGARQHQIPARFSACAT